VYGYGHFACAHAIRCVTLGNLLPPKDYMDIELAEVSRKEKERHRQTGGEPESLNNLAKKGENHHLV
jgi:hypothetical protein